LENKPAPANLGITSPLIGQHPDPRNGLCFATGLLVAFVGVLGLNRAIRTRNGTPLDRLLEQIGAGLAGFTGIGFALLLAATLYLGLRRVEFYFEVEEAAQVLAVANAGPVNNAGAWLYRVDLDGTAHTAPLRPALIRALTRRGVELPADRTRVAAVPGLSPLLLLTGVALWGVYRRLARRDRFEFDSPRQTRGAMLCLATSLYVLAWLTVGNYGNEIQIFEPAVNYMQAAIQGGMPLITAEPGSKEEVIQAFLRKAAEMDVLLFSVRMTEWKVNGIFFAVAAVWLLAATFYKLDDPALGARAKAGWGAMLFLLQVLLFLGVDAAARSVMSLPLALWGAAYLTTLAAAWTATQPATIWGVRS
jgi:hypothetical protein